MSRVRIRFCKQHDLRLISHRDLVRTIERLFRRAGVVVSMSEGFHPKPRMMFPSALAVGIDGLDEVLEVDFPESIEPASLLDRLNVHAPDGLTFTAADILPLGAKKAQAKSLKFEAPLPVDRICDVQNRVASLLASTSYPIQRADRAAPIDLRPLVEALEVFDGVLRMTLRLGQESGIRPREVLEALGLADLEAQGVHLSRTAVELQP